MLFLTVENDLGEQLELTRNRNFDVLEVSGLNPPNAAINTYAISGMDGTKFNSARVEQRNIIILLNIHHSIEENRLTLYRFFRVKKWLKLYVKTDTRDVYIEGYVESFENSAFTDLQKPQISIICPQPFFLAAVQDNVYFSESVPLSYSSPIKSGFGNSSCTFVSSGTISFTESYKSPFEFPFSIPSSGIEFSRRSQITNLLLNAGEIDIGMTILLHASASGVKNPVFYNLTTQEYFGVDITMQSGDLITICTETGKKSVTLLRSGAVTNLLADRKTGSSWVQLISGENRLSFDVDEGQSNLDATVIARQMFEGV